MLEYGLRFLAGGIAASAFAALGDTLRPKSFAGLFGAAPSIALMPTSIISAIAFTRVEVPAGLVAFSNRFVIHDSGQPDETPPDMGVT